MLQRGIFHLPKEYWKYAYEPIFDNDYDDEDADYDQEYFEQDRKNNVCGKPPEQKEDINSLYYDMLNEKNDENDYSDYDDDSWQF